MFKYFSILLIISFYFVFLNETNAQQTTVNSGVGPVSDIIVPAQTNMRNNFNLMYQVTFSRKDIPSPSFWYKIIFKDTSTFRFSLFPLNEKDKYDFYLYKIKDNYNFCSAVGEDKIISCDSSKTKPNETDNNLKEGLIGVKPIKVSGGDAIYLQVFAIKGWDGGHILDFKMSDSSSFVIKVENEYKDTTRTEANAMNIEKEFQNVSNKEMQEVFCKTMSSQNNEMFDLLNAKRINSNSVAANGTKGNNSGNGKGENDSGTSANSKSSNGSADDKANVKSKSIVSIFNTMKNKKLSKASNPVYVDNYIPEQGVFYKVQVGFYSSKIPPIKIFKGLSPVFQEKLPGGAKYSVGAYTTYEMASVAKGFVRSLGMNDAFVIAYYNGKRVTVAEAMAHEGENK